MDLQIVSTEMIKPSVPTPNHLKNYKLSFIDQHMVPLYIPLNLFYNTKFDLPNISEIHKHLKKSLSETLAIFYPLAGRIQNPASIDCNDKGVSYTEAIARHTLSEFLNEPHLNLLNKLLPLEANVLKNDEEVHVSIQVTILECGGLVIGTCVFHKICDFATMASFLRTWADLFHGKADQKVKMHQDLAVGSSLFPPLSSFPDDDKSDSVNYFFSDGKNHSITRRFVFNASSIATLRAKATSQNVPNPSRIETLTGFIAERVIAGLESGSKKPVPSLSILHPVNIRRRLDPPLADTAFGNLVWLVAAYYDSKKEISEYVETLRQVLQGAKAENRLEDAILENISASDMKVLKFTSWCNMGLYDLDFGWGKPCWVAHMADPAHQVPTNHQFLFLEGKINGEIELWAQLDEHDMALLENNQLFTAFATPNPSIPLEF